MVVTQLNEHLTANSFNEAYQSAYHQFHSIETALTCVMNDILLALDQRQSVLIVLLGLSTAFDTVDHQLVLGRLAGRIGLSGVPLRWVSSYLSMSTGQGSSASKMLRQPSDGPFKLGPPMPSGDKI